MLSKAQEDEINNRVKLVVTTFLSNEGINIKEMSQMLGIPSSTIQRDLNNINRITNIFLGDSKRILDIIRERLKDLKIKGNQKGGINYSEENIALKDQYGKFIGSSQRQK